MKNTRIALTAFMVLCSPPALAYTNARKAPAQQRSIYAFARPTPLNAPRGARLRRFVEAAQRGPAAADRPLEAVRSTVVRIQNEGDAARPVAALFAETGATASAMTSGEVTADRVSPSPTHLQRYRGPARADRRSPSWPVRNERGSAGTAATAIAGAIALAALTGHGLAAYTSLAPAAAPLFLIGAALTAGAFLLIPVSDHAQSTGNVKLGKRAGRAMGALGLGAAASFSAALTRAGGWGTAATIAAIFLLIVLLQSPSLDAHHKDR